MTKLSPLLMTVLAVVLTSCHQSSTDSRQADYNPWPQQISSPTCDLTFIYYLQEMPSDTSTVGTPVCGIFRAQFAHLSDAEDVLYPVRSISSPAISPNGVRLAYIGPLGQLYIRNILTGEQHPVASDALSPKWNGDDVLIYKLAGTGTVVRGTSGDPDLLALDADAFYAAPSNDGRIAFLRYRPSSTEIDTTLVCIADMTGDHEWVLARLAADAKHPAWSRDNSVIALTVFEDSLSPSIHFINAVTGRVQTGFIEHAVEPFYASDGIHLVYVALGNKHDGEHDSVFVEPIAP